MAILSRIIQLFKADIHGVMDQIEDRGLLLKQHLRDMEESLTAKEMKLKKMRSALDQAQQDYQKGEKETGNLEQELQVAIKKDRDDIARMLIKKLKPLNRLQSERRNHIERLSHEIDQFKAHHDQQRIQYEQLRQKTTEYFYRKEKQNWEPMWSAAQSDLRLCELSDEEVELELLQRKEALKGGAV
jgi:phage shock protein A